MAMAIIPARRVYGGKRKGRRVAVRRLPPQLRGFARVGGYYGRYGPRRAGRRNGQEWKFFDVDLDDALIATGGTVTNSINLIAQGVTEKTRVGRKCVVKSIEWRWLLNLDSTANMSTSTDTCRLILYKDKQCNGATIAVLDLLETADFQSFYNLANQSRFVVLMDRSYTLKAPSAIAGPVTGEDGRNGKFRKSCNVALEFDAAVGAITELRSNNFGVLVISKGGGILLDSKFRIRFSDG